MTHTLLENRRLASEHNTLGASMFEAGAVALAIEQFRIAVKLVPGDAAYWQNLGAALLERGSLDEAEAALIRSNRLFPYSEKVHFHLAQLFKTLGDREAQARELQLVIELAPDSHLAERAGQLLHGWKPKITLGLSGGENDG